MCGIAGYVGKKFIDQNSLVYTCKLMSTRGPDHTDYQTFKKKNLNGYFLHSRLSIIDNKSRSNQPYVYKNYILIFNGEIYNYLDLRKKLIQNGYNFKTKSDTEVLIKAYDFYKEKVFDKLEGMWSFAIFNKSNFKLILSRDRFGEKPLYYTKCNHGIYFGSEINYMKSLGNLKLKLNLSKLKNYLKYGYNSVFLNNDTFFEKIKTLEPSYNLILYKNKYKEKKYWFIERFKENNLNEKSTIKKIRTRLKQSINIRAKSLKQNALHLSGGIDSSGICAMTNKKYQTFSISNKKSNIYNEKKIINKNRKFFSVKNYMYDIENINFYEELKELSKKYQSPILNINSISQYYLNKKIKKKGIKVSISGSGSDEIFAGYYDHFLGYLNSIKKNKKLFDKNFILYKKLIYPIIRNIEFKNLNRINKPIYTRLSDKNDFDYTLKKSEKINTQNKKYFKSNLKNILFHQIKENIYPTVYNDDLTAMSASIENRSPFLDSKIAKYVFEMNSKFYMKNCYSKYILRCCLKGKILPEILNNRRKIGYNINLFNFRNIKKKLFYKLLDTNKKTLLKAIHYKNLYKYIEKINIKNLNNEESKFLFRILSINLFLKYSPLCKK